MGRFESLEELLAVAPAPPRSQLLANELMEKYADDPNFVDVYIDGDEQVRVALKGALPSFETIDGIRVSVVPTDFSLLEFDRFAEILEKLNPTINEVSVDVPASTLTVYSDDASLTSSGTLRRDGLPDIVAIRVVQAPAPVLDAAEGGQLVAGTGCTTGFRVKSGSPPIWRLTSANHSACGTTWGPSMVSR